MTSVFLNLVRLVLWPLHLPWRRFDVCLRMGVLPLLHGMFCWYLLHQFGPKYSSNLTFSYWFSVKMLYPILKVRYYSGRNYRPGRSLSPELCHLGEDWRGESETILSSASKLILLFVPTVCWNFSTGNLDFHTGSLAVADCLQQGSPQAPRPWLGGAGASSWPFQPGPRYVCLLRNT